MGHPCPEQSDTVRKPRLLNAVLAIALAAATVCGSPAAEARLRVGVTGSFDVYGNPLIEPGNTFPVDNIEGVLSTTRVR